MDKTTEIHRNIWLRRVKTLTFSALKGTLWKITTIVTKSVHKYNIAYIKVKEWVYNTKLCTRASTWVLSCVRACVKYIKYITIMLCKFQIFGIYKNLFSVDKFILTVFLFVMVYICIAMYNFAVCILIFILMYAMLHLCTLLFTIVLLLDNGRLMAGTCGLWK